MDSESDIEQDLNFYDRLSTFRETPRIPNKVASDSNQVEFRDFLEPNLIKTGHIIPLASGHNGTMS